MRILLDTHSFLWYISGSSKISPVAKGLIQNRANAAYFSIASLWEIAIKNSLGKLPLAQPFQVLIPAQLQLHGIIQLPVELKHIEQIVTLPHHHGDPFDCMLVAQCHVENLPIVSRDPQFDAYGVQRLW